MTRLLSAGFARLFKDKLFWIGNLFFSGFFIFIIIMNYRSMAQYPEAYPYTGSTYMFAPFQISGLFASCFTGMFLGTEYKDGTLRNKLIIGCTRTQVYLSNLIVTFVASLFASTISVLSSFAVGLALMGAPELTLFQMLTFYGFGVLMLASFAGIFTLISMLIPSRSAGSMTCILFFFALTVAGTYVLSRLDAQEFTTPGYTLTIDGVLQPMDPIPNPLYLRGIKRSVYEFFRDLLPTSVGSMLMAQMVIRPLIQTACSLGIVILTSVSGIFHFSRKNLK